jgi:hypothetical protein
MADGDSLNAIRRSNLVALSAQEYPGQYRELSLLVLLPTLDLEDSSPFIHPGTQFLVEHRAQLFLDCSSPGSQGRMVNP